MHFFPRSRVAFFLALSGLLTGCPAEEPPLSVGERPGAGPELPEELPVGRTPLRRLTQEELNATLRDLFTRDGVRIAIPFVPLNDGEAGSGVTPFEGEVTRQTPSDLVVEQLRAGATVASAFALAERDLLLPRTFTPGDVDDEKAVGEQLVAELLPRALRRPTDPSEVETYAAFFRARYEEHGNNLDVALALVMQAILQAPSFVYRIEIGGAPIAPGDGTSEPITVALQAHEIASRLSYLLWGSMPDDALFAAAANDELVTPEQIEGQARRMLDDDKARDALLSFHRQWLDLDAVLRQNKDAATYPDWNDDLRVGLRNEIDAMIEDVVFERDGRLATLLSTTTTRVDANVASLYGIPAPAGGVDDLVQLPGNERAGVLTSGAFLASRAHQVFGSPVLRGVFILDRFLCEKPPPPDPFVDVTPPDETDAQEPTTNRSRYAQHTFDATCQGCHAGIDGIGFGLEHYDAVGRYRTADNGFPVDASGNFDGSSLGGTFTGAVEMSALLASSDLVHDCVARQYLSWSRGRSNEPVDVAHDLEILDAFRGSDGDLRELLVAIAVSPGFRSMPMPPGGAQ